MNFDTFNESYLSIPRSYFTAKQNALDFLTNINNLGGGVFKNFCLLNNTSSESFFFPSNIFIIFSYGFRPAAGLPTLFFNRAKSSRHAVRMRGRTLLSTRYGFTTCEDSPFSRIISIRCSFQLKSTNYHQLYNESIKKA